jgi:LmbE family N-acetylglucosaminyl deacetylase
MALNLAAVFAHPDDDTFGLAGTLTLARGETGYTLIVATSGEAGPIADPSLATRETLAGVREAEQREALRIVGQGEADIHFLRYPDGGVKDVPRAEIVGRVAELLAEARPQVVVTFGPEGVTRHDDHIAIGRIASEAFHVAREAAQPGAFERLFYVAIPTSDLDGFWRALRERGVDVGDPDGPFMPQGVPDETISVRVDCTEVLRTKVDAIRAHRTQQADPDSFPEDVHPEIFGTECFVQAWPPVSQPADHPAEGLFEGLVP